MKSNSVSSPSLSVLVNEVSLLDIHNDWVTQDSSESFCPPAATLTRAMMCLSLSRGGVVWSSRIPSLILSLIILTGLWALAEGGSKSMFLMTQNYKYNRHAKDQIRGDLDFHRLIKPKAQGKVERNSNGFPFLQHAVFDRFAECGR